MKLNGAQLAVAKTIPWLKSAQQPIGSFGMSPTNKNHKTQGWHAALQDQIKITTQLKSFGKGDTQEV